MRNRIFVLLLIFQFILLFANSDGNQNGNQILVGNDYYFFGTEKEKVVYFPLKTSVADDLTIKVFGSTCDFRLYFRSGVIPPDPTPNFQLYPGFSLKSDGCQASVSLSKNQVYDDSETFQILYYSTLNTTDSYFSINVQLDYDGDVYAKAKAGLVISIILLSIALLITIIIVIFLARWKKKKKPPESEPLLEQDDD
ncbi:hypothetical protein M0811_10496 [Anaeramoeba ignava]|uniref:Uncharacterized protein n=1 Tax=Anaeramoeba ignava TaxID=1746090 RepID=A0A9Q0LF48_ANAIG|nr:hypothetical protein M0811_10496 [Anaeramoeba ignava]